MENNYFILIGNKKAGPHTVSEINSMELPITTMVWNEQLEDWTNISEVDELKAKAEEVRKIQEKKERITKVPLTPKEKMDLKKKQILKVAINYTVKKGLIIIAIYLAIYNLITSDAELNLASLQDHGLFQNFNNWSYRLYMNVIMLLPILPFIIRIGFLKYRRVLAAENNESPLVKSVINDVNLYTILIPIVIIVLIGIGAIGETAEFFSDTLSVGTILTIIALIPTLILIFTIVLFFYIYKLKKNKTSFNDEEDEDVVADETINNL